MCVLHSSLLSIPPLPPSLPPSLIHSLTYSPTRSLTHLPTHTHSPTHLFTHPLLRHSSPTHSSHSLAHSFLPSSLPPSFPPSTTHWYQRIIPSTDGQLTQQRNQQALNQYPKLLWIISTPPCTCAYRAVLSPASCRERETCGNRSSAVAA